MRLSDVCECLLFFKITTYTNLTYLHSAPKVIVQKWKKHFAHEQILGDYLTAQEMKAKLPYIWTDKKGKKTTWAET